MARGLRMRVPGRPALCPSVTGAMVGRDREAATVTERELLHAVDVRAPIATVWAELIRRGGPQRAMLDSVLDSTLLPGDPLAYRSRDGRRVFAVGRVIEVVPPYRFAHTQQLTGRDDPVTLVTWLLSDAPGGTRVTVRHTGWPSDTADLDRIDAIWGAVLPALRRLVETGSVGPRTRLRQAARRAIGWARPPGTAAEAVPPPDREAPLGPADGL